MCAKELHSLLIRFSQLRVIMLILSIYLVTKHMRFERK